MTSHKGIDKIMKMLQRYYVCHASEELLVAAPFDWNGDNHAMYLDLKRRINAHFDKKKKTESNSLYSRVLRTFFSSKSTGTKASYGRLTWNAVLFALQLYAHTFWFQGFWVSIPCVIMLHWLLSSSLLHNGTHYALVKDPSLNLFLSAFGGFFHSPNIMWEMQHVISHHSYTNINELDIDLNHFLDHWRVTKEQKHEEKYKKWRFKMPLIFALTSIGQIDFWTGRIERHIVCIYITIDSCPLALICLHSIH